MIRDQLLAALHLALDASGFPAPSEGIELTPPKNTGHGDFTTNVALQLAKPLGAAPRDVAAKLVVGARTRATGPPGTGRDRGPRLPEPLPRAVVAPRGVARRRRAGETYGHGHALAGRRLNLEFVSANPTGPLHAGGGRWVAVGDALANLLAAQGAVVHREYYLNDAGNQLDTFAASVMARYRGEDPPEDGYQGEYVTDMAVRMRTELGDDVSEEQAREWAYRDAVRGLREDLARLGVQFDTWFSERTLHEAGNVARALDDLRARGVVDRARGRHLAAHDRLR